MRFPLLNFIKNKFFSLRQIYKLFFSCILSDFASSQTETFLVTLNSGVGSFPSFKTGLNPMALSKAYIFSSK